MFGTAFPRCMIPRLFSSVLIDQSRIYCFIYRHFSIVKKHASIVPKIEAGDFDCIIQRARELTDASRSEEAKLWLEIAAKNDNAEAYYLLGIHYMSEKKASHNATTAKEVIQEIDRARKAAKNAKKKLKAQKTQIDFTSDIEKLPFSLSALPPEELSKFWLRKAADLGHGNAMCLLGNQLLQTDNSQLCIEGVEWYRKATNLEFPNSDALYNLGTLYHDGNSHAGIQQDLEVSVNYFHRAANAEDAAALYWLGHCYSTGEGGAKHINPALAVDFLQRAGMAGHPKAYYLLATVYRSGLRVHSNCSCATTTSTGGIPDLEYIAPNAALFHQFLRLAVENEDPDALYCLADIKMHGLEGVAQDELEAVRLYAQASEAGHAEASLCLGALHYNGLAGVEKSFRRAFELYNIAAEQGCLEAWRNLASMYFLGEGIPKCEKTAREIMRVMFSKTPSEISLPDLSPFERK